MKPNRSYQGETTSTPPTIEATANGDAMTFSPGSAVAKAGTRYTEAVKQKLWRERTTLPADNEARIAASTMTCPASPATSGALTRHSFARNATTCAFCDETPAWILAAPQQQEEPNA